MSNHDLHHDWLALIEISGPFLAVPVLKEAFPQGLEELDGTKRKRLRQAYEEWREALETDDPQFAELHAAWIDEVLARGLELDEDGKGDVLKRADWCAAELNVSLPEHGVTLSPDLAVIDEQRADKPQMLIHTYGQDVDLDATLKLDGWAATPADRMVQLCRATGCRLGLVTNGERWMLVDAPVGAVTTFASWYARIWSQEPITLQAFVHLLGIRRFFVDETEQLPALFDRSLKYQDEVTDALGEQVRRAVEVLIQALDKADQDRDRELLRDVKEPVLYEAALTVMMRLVFLLSAEERGLLLLGDERYEANYALSTLRMQLRKESEEILERRWDAWSRLLAIFRAVFGGIEHENLRLPALGGSMFDPDLFPSSRAAPRAPTGAPTRPSRCRSTTAPCCCCSKPSSSFRAGHCPTVRWTSNRSVTSTRACWNAPSSAPPRSRWNWMGPRMPKPPGSSWPSWNPPASTVPNALPNCSRSAPAVLPAACATIW